MTYVEIGEAAREAVRLHMSDGKVNGRIDALKYVRSKTNCRLREAMIAVETLRPTAPTPPSDEGSL